MAVIASSQNSQKSFTQFPSIWGSCVIHLLKTYNSLHYCEQALYETPQEEVSIQSQALLTHLKKMNLVSHSHYNQYYAQFLTGVMHFKQGNFKTSLSLWRSVLDRDPSNMEVLPALAWNCLLLGLTSDAKNAMKQYKKFHQKLTRVNLYKQLCEPAHRTATLIYLCKGVISGDYDRFDRFDRKWQSLGLMTAEFDYEVLLIIYKVLRGDQEEARMLIKKLYQTYQQEWLPAVLWALFAYGEKDLAACDHRLNQAIQKAPQQKHFIGSLTTALLSSV
jgi:tetratricopeptide (TPR) repeat protein